MKYIIDLDELTKWQIENDTLPIVPFVKQFLKSKSPVEEIAEGIFEGGRLEYEPYTINTPYTEKLVLGMEFLKVILKDISEQKNHKVKIYLEVIK